MGVRLLQWPKVATEGFIIGAIPDDKLIELVANDEEGLTGYRMRTLAERLGIDAKDWASIDAALEQKKKPLKALIIEAATGSTDGAPKDDQKVWKKHAQDWFKRDGGGEELARKMMSLGAWATMKDTVLPLINAVLNAVDKKSIGGLPT